VLVAPLMPGVNDSPEQVAEVVRLATEAGAAYVSGIALHLRRGVREVFMEWLGEHRPELVPRYEALYRRGAYAPAEERRRLVGLITGARAGAAGPSAGFARGQEGAERRRSAGANRPPAEPAAPRLF
jgi:DNA repair photolyase